MTIATRLTATALLAGLLLVAAGCGRQEHRAPDVTGLRLDLAQDRLEAVGLGYDTVGGGTFGVVIRSHWFVCEQEPKAGEVTKTVRLVVARSCMEPRHTPAIVPNVVGESLDVAEDELERLGFRFETYPTDGGPIVVRENWTVCDQYPTGGESGEGVELYVQHDCFDDD